MSLFYKIVSTFRPGEGLKGKKIWFPKLTGSSQVNLERLCEIIEKRSTFTGADVTGVLVALRDLIPELLCEGKSIKIEGLGTFRIHARVLTSDTEEEVTSRNIREFRLSFKPDNKIKKLLQSASVTKV